MCDASRRPFPAHEWAQRRETIAQARGQGDKGTTVSTAYSALNELNWRGSELVANDITPTDWDKFKDEARNTRERVQVAERALQQLGR